MRVNKKWILPIGAVASSVLGFALLWWPLMFFAPVVAALYGYWFVGLVLAVLADLLLGVPVGIFHTLLFPCTIVTLICIAGRSVMVRHIR